MKTGSYPKPAEPRRRSCDRPFELPVRDVLDSSRVDSDDRAPVPCRPALRGLRCELDEEPLDVLVVGRVRPGEPGGADTRSTTQCVDLEARVLPDDPLGRRDARAPPLRFGPGVLLEGRAHLLADTCRIERTQIPVGQRPPKLSAACRGFLRRAPPSPPAASVRLGLPLPVRRDRAPAAGALRSRRSRPSQDRPAHPG